MDGSSDWRFKTHLANLPIYYEYKDEKVSDAKKIKGTYLDNYKKVFDLYITDSTCNPADLSTKTGDDSEGEFLNSEAVFYQNGSWEYGNLSKKFKDDELQMIPIYFGVDDENEGLATGTENYWCVNKNASKEDIKATLEFMNWCVTSDKGTTAMSEKMGFTIPFDTAKESPNLFVKQDAEYTKAGKTPVSWNFTTMPSEEWKNTLGSALTGYAAKTGKWDAVKEAFVDNWATEKELAKAE
jgi:raffinose/stachyose/melibiose transport system substrate-binding protein